MTGVERHHGDPDQRSAMQLDVTGLCGGNVVLSFQLSHDRPNDRPLLLQRTNITEQNVELQRPYERGFSRSS